MNNIIAKTWGWGVGVNGGTSGCFICGRREVIVHVLWEGRGQPTAATKGLVIHFKQAISSVGVTWPEPLFVFQRRRLRERNAGREVVSSRLTGPSVSQHGVSRRARSAECVLFLTRSKTRWSSGADMTEILERMICLYDFLIERSHKSTFWNFPDGRPTFSVYLGRPSGEEPREGVWKGGDGIN